MHVTVALIVLAALPPALMAISHVYALSTQDKKTWCVVILDNRVRSVETVVAQHQRRYELVVAQSWDATTKGYRARIPLQKIPELQADHRVAVVKAWEADEFRHPKTFA